MAGLPFPLPYATAIAGEVVWDERIFGYEWALGPDSRNVVDSAALDGGGHGRHCHVDRCR